MEVVIVLAALLCAVVLIAAPFRSRRAVNEAAARSAERAELEAAKEAKYREIREAELDYRTGKLSEDDWRVVDSGLRAEAVDLLRRLDAMGEEEG
jgi:type II secretory pathway pseudopilin PulG